MVRNLCILSSFRKATQLHFQVSILFCSLVQLFLLYVYCGSLREDFQHIQAAKVSFVFQALPGTIEGDSSLIGSSKSSWRN